MSYGSKTNYGTPKYGGSNYGGSKSQYGAIIPYQSGLEEIALNANNRHNSCPQCGFKMGENIPQSTTYKLDSEARLANNAGLSKVMAGYYAAKGKSSPGKGGSGGK